jgi:hypothetical protein
MYTVSKVSFAALASLFIVACQPTAAPESAMVEASASDLSSARTAVAICRQHMPDNSTAYAALVRSGFVEIATDRRVAILESPTGTVAVTVSRFDPLEKICAVTVTNMSPSQGIQLIQPWVAHTNGVPNERLSNKSAAAWRGQLDGDIVFTGVAKRSMIETIKGAWIRMIVVDR